MIVTPEEILDFWFTSIGEKRWFVPDVSLSSELTAQFLETFEAAERGELKKWEATPEGVVSLLLLYGVFSRHFFPKDKHAFANDDVAIDLARDAIIKHFDDRIDRTFKLFFYIPFLNSENEGNQRLALFYIRERTKENAWIQMAEASLDTILRYGRFPARDAALGRAPSQAAV